MGRGLMNDIYDNSAKKPIKLVKAMINKCPLVAAEPTEEAHAESRCGRHTYPGFRTRIPKSGAFDLSAQYEMIANTLTKNRGNTIFYQVTSFAAGDG